jgi:glycine/D-amino acid oxidase-like deaminating enzyme
VWERDPDAYSYHPVGYMQISPEVMHAQVATIYEQQRSIGYESVFVEGERESLDYMKGIFDDWQARGITSVLHEKRGGYANNMAAMRGLAGKARALGVEVLPGVEVTGFRAANGAQTIGGVETSLGTIACEELVVAVGPWINGIWNMLDLPRTIEVKGRDGKRHEGVRMWHYMALQEGTLGVDPDFQKTNDGRMPPVIHVDTDAPLHSDRNGRLLTDGMWGVYYKPDFHFQGVQGGAMPATVDRDADDVRVDPYGPESPEFVVTDDFADMWTSALAFCQKRFEGKHALYRDEPSGGIGCFTPDSFPVFDRFRDNVYVIADSNHGFKMIGVGELVAGELLGEKAALLEPFRFARYAKGALHPVSNSPFPWS